MKFVIIGSGPTALGAGYRLQQLIENGTISPDTQVLIVEKENDVGGLARSVTDARGFTWDLGVHVTGNSKYLKFTHVINEAVHKWNNVPRCVKAFMNHVIQDENVHKNYVPYPVQDSIPYFPDPVKLQCLQELKELASCSETPNNFAQFTECKFGATLQKEFIRPYNEKVWTIPMEEMNCAWVENRVPLSNLEDLKKRCEKTREELIEHEKAKNRVVFKYPKELRGMGAVWRVVASFLPRKWLRFSSAVTAIDVEKKKITVSDGSTTSYDHIISTIPIVELGKMTGLAPNMTLKYSKVVLVGIGLRRPQPEFTEDLSWLYFPLKETVFYRCTFISNFNEKMTPNAAVFWSVICEIGLPSDSDVDEEVLIDRSIQDLVSHGIVDDPSLVVDRWVSHSHHVLPYGYPIPTLGRDEELAQAHQLLHKNHIYSRGRFGSWKYEAANQDHSFMMGCEVVDRILFNTDENVFS